MIITLNTVRTGAGFATGCRASTFTLAHGATMGRQWWRRPRRPVRGSPAPASGPTAQLPVGPGESRSPLPAFQPPAGFPPAGGVVFYSGRPSGRVPSGLCRWCRPAAAFARVVAGRAAARLMAARRRAGCGAVKALREWRGRPTPAGRPMRPRRRPLPLGFAATGALPRPCFWQYVTNSFAAVANRTVD